jgi:hypothetical protein
LKKKNYNIAISAFRFLKATADYESTSFSALISDGILAASEADLQNRVPSVKRASRGRGRTQGRKQIGLLLSENVIKKLDALADSMDVWPGDVIDACIAIRCKGRDAALKCDVELIELLRSDVIPVTQLPECSTNVSVQGLVKRVPLTKKDTVCIDSTLLFLALTKCSDAYYKTHISPGAAQILWLVLSGKLTGVTTTLDLLEFAVMLENADILPEWLTAKSGRHSEGEVRNEEIKRRIQLLTSSSLQIIDVDLSSVVEGMTFARSVSLRVRAKIAAYLAEITPPLKVAGATTDYGEFSPSLVTFLQLGAFDIEKDGVEEGIIVGNRIPPFSEPAKIPKKAPHPHSTKRTLNAHQEALEDAAIELRRLMDRTERMEEDEDPKLEDQTRYLIKATDNILENERNILHMLGKKSKRLTGYLPKNRKPKS